MAVFGGKCKRGGSLLKGRGSNGVQIHIAAMVSFIIPFVVYSVWCVVDVDPNVRSYPPVKKLVTK